MTPSEAVNQAEPHCIRFIYGSFIAITILCAVFLIPFFYPVRILFVFIVPLILAGGIFQMIILYRQGQSNLPRAFFILGVVLLLGGALFDMIITVIKSPTLELESNPIARILLDSGYSTGFVYGYGALAQSLLIILECTMWASLLRHRETIIASANYEHSTYFDFFKSAHGGEDLTWRQFFFPIKISEFSKKYHMTWLFIVVWTGANQARWFFALEWLNIGGGNRIIITSLLTMLFVLGYEIWLLTKYLSFHKHLVLRK